MSPFAIEFEANEWELGDAVDGDAPLIATALRGYHRWWMEMRCQMPGRPNWDRRNGIEIVKIGTVKREE